MFSERYGRVERLKLPSVVGACRHKVSGMPSPTVASFGCFGYHPRTATDDEYPEAYMPKLFAGLDVSQETTAICVVDEHGLPIFEVAKASTPSAIGAALRAYRKRLVKVGHETGLFTPWLHKELLRQHFPAVCLDARRTRAALAAQRNKTDKNDARDIAIALSRGFDGAAYVKSDEAHRMRALLTYRRTLKRKARDLEATIRSTVKTFGARIEKSGGNIVVRRNARAASDPLLDDLNTTLLRARAALLLEAGILEKRVRQIASGDPVCKRLMTAPGVGPITALTFKAAIDDPARFGSSRVVGAHFGLTPKRKQSGETDVRGRISKYGDGEVRSALYEAAATMLNCCRKESAYRTWGLKLVKAKGLKFAATACARKLAVILHRMWATETNFEAHPQKGQCGSALKRRATGAVREKLA